MGSQTVPNSPHKRRPCWGQHRPHVLVLWMGPGRRDTPVSPQPAWGIALAGTEVEGWERLRVGEEDADVEAASQPSVSVQQKVPQGLRLSSRKYPRGSGCSRSRSHRHTHILHLEPQGILPSLPYRPSGENRLDAEAGGGQSGRGGSLARVPTVSPLLRPGVHPPGLPLHAHRGSLALSTPTPGR